MDTGCSTFLSIILLETYSSVIRKILFNILIKSSMKTLMIKQFYILFTSKSHKFSINTMDRR